MNLFERLILVFVLVMSIRNAIVIDRIRTAFLEYLRAMNEMIDQKEKENE